jgi:hypothetical protein
MIAGHQGNEAMRRADGLLKILHFLRGRRLAVTAKKSRKSLKDAPDCLSGYSGFNKLRHPNHWRGGRRKCGRQAVLLAPDLPPEAASFLTRVCGLGFHILNG